MYVYSYSYVSLYKAQNTQASKDTVLFGSVVLTGWLLSVIGYQLST